MPETNPPPNREIPARNRRQAMDWSLVLASQGIEHSIERTDEAGWMLVVASETHAAALEAIHQYRIENRHWRLRRPILEGNFFFDWSSLAWVALVFLFYWGSGAHPDLKSLGMMDGAAVSRGEWWRLFTATWLHADAEHLATNLVFGLLFLGLAMGRYGPGIGLLAAYVSGAGGNVMGWLVGGASHRSLGASGVVMGALGLLAVQSPALLRQGISGMSRLFTGGFLAGVLLFVLLGFSPGADLLAHFGGFVSGALIGALLLPTHPAAHKMWINLGAGFLFTLLVIWPWLLAMSRAG